MRVLHVVLYYRPDACDHEMVEGGSTQTRVIKRVSSSKKPFDSYMETPEVNLK